MTNNKTIGTAELEYYDSVFKRQPKRVRIPLIGSRKRKWFRELLQRVRADGGTVLDVGCGQGDLLSEAVRRGNACFGLDLSKSGLLKTSRENPGANLVLCDVCSSFPFNDFKFDFVFSLGVLEHLPELNRTLAEIVRVSGPTTKICVTVANKDALFGRIVRKTGIGKDYWPINNLRNFNDWAACFERERLRIVKVVKDDPIVRGWNEAATWRGLAAKLLSQVLFPLIPFNISSAFTFYLVVSS